ncbi:MAG: hypothetical protein JW958_13880 [Candidatus Eisenbacteria bacterium]|nr:hypothetical protein [Candidatus Eisenbacteria bacterium]
MRKLIVLLVVAAFAVTAAYAEKVDHPKFNPSPTPFNASVGARAYFEGFEGTFPPAGWGQGITNATYTWMQDATSSYEGTYAAWVGWQSGEPQDERLAFTYTIDSAADEDHLTFATMGSPYWSAYADFTVDVGGVVVFDYYLDNQGGDFVWEQYDIDLSAYDGQTIDITFKYAGDDGADHHFDAVSICGGIVIPDPPVNNTCAGAIVMPCGAVDLSGDTQYATNDYSPGEYGTSCTGYSAAGNDVTYVFTLTAATDVQFDYTSTADGSFYIVTDCADPVNTCVIGADATFTGETETIVTTLDPGTYYLIADSYSGSGTFTLTGLIDCTSGTEDASWGSVKTLFR